MKKIYLAGLGIGSMLMGITLAIMIFGLGNTAKNTTNLSSSLSGEEREQAQTAYFAGGCFWCMEGIFEAQEGVYETVSGYIGGSAETATYNEVSSGMTKHREGVRVVYNPEIITYATLVELFWTQIDPTDAGGQFTDRGYHYTTAIFYRNEEEKLLAEASKKTLEDSGKFETPIVTLILPATPFYDAESYHQDYYKKSALRYNLYKKGSGREGFIDENWKGEISQLTPPPANAGIPLDEGEQNKVSFVEGDARRAEGVLLENIYSEKSLKERLTPLQYKVTQEGATERAFDNEYWDNKEAGIYVDIIDGTPLYSSLDKYDSGTGWPSFTKPIDIQYITEHEDNTLFTKRTEVKSASSNAHLGHVFPDGPQDAGGLRYCMNSAAMKFIPVERLEEDGYGEYLELFQ